MKTEYDISTKEKEISCLEIVDDILYTKLGFKPANSGSRLLRDLIIYIYNKNNYEFFVEKELKLFLIDKKMKCNYKTAKSKIIYAINNAKKNKIEKNFYNVFKIDYDPCFLSIKNIVNVILLILDNNRIL